MNAPDTAFAHFDALPMGVFIIDSDYRLHYWNRCLENWTGLRAAELAGTDARRVVPALERADCHARILDVFRLGVPAVFSPQLHGPMIACEARPGVARVQATTVTALTSPRTHSNLAVFSVQDVTELTLRLNDARVATGKLQQELDRRNQLEAELCAAKEAAEQANRAKSEFLAIMSHEIRTPMNAILGMAEVLWESPLTPQQRKYVEVFRRAGEGLLNLINDILDLSRIEAGKLELEEIGMDLEETISRCVELIEPKAREKGIHLEVMFTPRPDGLFSGDPGRLQQVLMNLLGNAVKFTEQGMIRLSVEGIAAEREGHSRWRFTVADTGIGIPPERLDTIFDVFSQGDSSTTRRFGGTGLGLAIARRIVAAMGGRLEVISIPNSGSEFSFEAEFRDAGQHRGPASEPVREFFGSRVLVVDENHTNRNSITESFHLWGFSVTEVDSPAEAMAALRQAEHTGELFVLATVDAGSLRGDAKFAPALALTEATPSLPVILMTADAQPVDSTQCRELGLAGYGVHPMGRPELLGLVRSALRKSRGADAQQRPLRSLRILIAEDSSDNRMLVEAYLAKTRHHLTFAVDGREALERYRAAANSESPFQLVLMDIQMPLLDGLSATRALRQWEQAHGIPRVPVVAFTASALAHDRAAALDAGCDAHLSKPISKGDLIACIDNYTARPSSPIPVQVPEDLEDIAPVYLESRHQELPVLRQCCKEGDFARIRTIAHQLKGSGGSYGMPALSRLGSALEAAATNEDTAAIDDNLDQIADFITRARFVSAV